MTAALEIPSPSIPALPAPALEAVAQFTAEALAPNTRRAYRSAWSAFTAWCGEQRLQDLPATPETVAAFVAAEAQRGRSVATIEQRVAAIRWAHELEGHAIPTAHKGVRVTLQGVRRVVGVAAKGAAPATADRIAAMAAHAPTDTLKGLRDRALLLLGFASAMRRSELVALDLEDVDRTDQGLILTLRRSKTDQQGRGHQRAIPFGQRAETCPIRALDAWLEAAGITGGAILRSVDRHGRVGGRLSAHAVALVVKQHARRAGLDAEAFSGHSLRAGFVTAAAERGAKFDRIMDHTGHRSVAMVRRYTRRADAFADHAGAGLL